MECPICFDKQWLVKTPCKHSICLKCILDLRNNECPYCRKKNIFDSLPTSIKTLTKMFSKNNDNKPKTSVVNIDNYYDFPPLGS